METLLYEGIRLDINGLTFNRDILATIKPALNRTKQHTFHNIGESGTLGAYLYIKNIKIQNYSINEDRFAMRRYQYLDPIYHLQGSFEAINFYLSFDYSMTWLGIPLSYGTGKGIVTSVSNEVLVFFNESYPDVQIPHPWDVMNITLPWNIFSPSSWVESLLEAKFINEFHRIVDEAMFDFGKNILKPYVYVEDIFPHDIDLIFENKIIAVKPALRGSYLSIAFDTNITVNKTFVRNMYRRIEGEVSGQGDFCVCMASQLTPDVIDVLGHAGFFDSKVPYYSWKFSSNTVSALFQIMPNLKNIYNGNEVFEINCAKHRFYTVNDLSLNRSTDSILEMQIPYHCTFDLADGTDRLLTVNSFLRQHYEMEAKNDSYISKGLETKAYGFNTVPKLAQLGHDLIKYHLESYAKSFYGKDLLSPGIKIIPNRRDELDFAGSFTKKDEICFYYNEKRF